MLRLELLFERVGKEFCQEWAKMWLFSRDLGNATFIAGVGKGSLAHNLSPVQGRKMAVMYPSRKLITAVGQLLSHMLLLWFAAYFIKIQSSVKTIGSNFLILPFADTECQGYCVAKPVHQESHKEQ